MLKKFKNKIELGMAVGFYDSGVAHADRGEWGQAIDDFTKVVQLNPGVGEAYYNRGVAHTKIGNSTQALADFTKALELKPDDPVMLHNRAVVQYQLKNIKSAREDIEEVKRLGGRVNPEFEKMLNGAIK
jgi:Flp pilus assembly protein TadD